MFWGSDLVIYKGRTNKAKTTHTVAQFVHIVFDQGCRLNRELNQIREFLWE